MWRGVTIKLAIAAMSGEIAIGGFTESGFGNLGEVGSGGLWDAECAFAVGIHPLEVIAFGHTLFFLAFDFGGKEAAHEVGDCRTFGGNTLCVAEGSEVLEEGGSGVVAVVGVPGECF